METRDSRLERFRLEHPAAWSLLKFAASKGLASIDGPRDRVLLTTELRRQKPEVHDALGGAMEMWRRPQLRR